ncbi:hypothetical protein SAMN00017405_0206 [Desulfonispora thiosulfatigenes DSM 11270]|uniref:YIEGIA protein n=1 Tax=Desulfonispora thiosulfatigenes DSM 11270 TaxID=656914 RepID=A0A1W1VMB6_DESTI|nr:YIEGIA family protein [Desulfonispora thiosulfatigenes]SMB94433.1 hypothetical protein SAMN00017405_0206 [Desulfonispora thiosulfatigenes DSM 11270]
MDRVNEAITLGIFIGFLARVILLRSDYRNYPSYPHEYVTHLSLGLIAATLAAMAIPALLQREYTAVTFLVLAAQQFRDIRNMERQTLAKLEETLLVRRGSDYIEGIAKVFESRNYLVMLSSLFTTGCAIKFGLVGGTMAGIISLLIARMLMKGTYIEDIAEISPAKVSFKNSILMVDDIVIMNVGLKSSKDKIMQDAIGVTIHPKDDNARLTLNNIGQRQAILHNVSTLLGSKVEIGEPDFTPSIRKDIDTGKLGLFVVPNEKDLECLISAIYKTPVLESSKQKPLSNEIGRKASD